jgi:hypothetical protein
MLHPQPFDRSQSATRRAISAGIVNIELTLISRCRYHDRLRGVGLYIPAGAGWRLQVQIFCCASSLLSSRLSRQSEPPGHPWDKCIGLRPAYFAMPVTIDWRTRCIKYCCAHFRPGLMEAKEKPP